MTRTQLRGMPRQDLIERARILVEAAPDSLPEHMVIEELADRLEDCGRTDDYPFNTENHDEH